MDGNLWFFGLVRAQSCRRLLFFGRSLLLFFGLVSARLSGSGAAFGFLRGAVWSLWRGFWFSGSDTFRLWRGSFGGAAGGARKSITATQQGAAPDRLQLRLSAPFVPLFAPSLRFRRRVSLVVISLRAT